MQKKIVIAGATGLIGRHLSELLASSDYKISALVRNTEKAGKEFSNSNIEVHEWNINKSIKDVSTLLEGSHAIINLAGASVGGKRWNEQVKKELYDSRIDSTRQLVNAIELCKNKPEVYITSCGTGIYGFRGNEDVTENSTYGNDFLARLCIDWEKEAFIAEKFCRVVSIRTAVVLDKNEGALKEFMTPFKFFIGGWFGDGKQWFPWIHREDIIDIYKLCIEDISISGPLNAVSPDTVRNKEFCKALGEAMNRPCLIPIPGFALKIVVGEFAETLLNGQKVIPERLQGMNYQFQFKNLNSALENLLK